MGTYWKRYGWRCLWGVCEHSLMPCLMYREFNGSIVAVKLVPYNPHNAALRRELMISTTVQHNNVICTDHYYRVYDEMQGEWLLALIMERADCNLKQYLIDRRNLSYESRKKLVVEIATGLDYLYNQHITLHDIKVLLGNRVCYLIYSLRMCWWLEALQRFLTLVMHF